MAGKIASGFELSKQSWAALNHNRQLVVFPIISMIGMAIVTILFFIPGAVLVNIALGGDGTAQWIPSLVLLFVYYLVTYTIVIFSNTALVGATMKLIRGEPATVRDGLHIAFTRLGKIFVYALISATVGVIARAVTQAGRDSNNAIVAILAALAGGILQGAWSIVVFFAVPIIVAEDLDVKDTLQRSWHLFTETWGEGFVGSAAIGGISCLAYLAVLIIGGGIVAAGIYLNTIPLIVVGAIILLFGFVLIGLLSGAVNGIFQASLYNFATTGNAGPFIDTELARRAFVPAKVSR